MLKIKTILLSVICALTIHVSKANNIDSLRNLLKTPLEDTVKVKVLNSIGEDLRRSKPKDALEVYQEALDISERNQYKYGIMLSTRGKGICYIFLGSYELALEQTYRSLKIAEELNDYDGTIKAYNNIGTVHLYIDKLDDALVIYNRLEDKIKPKDFENLLRLYVNTAIILRDKEMYDSSLFRYKKALKIATESNDKNSQAVIYHNIRNLYLHLENYKEARIAFVKGLYLAKQANNSTVLAAGLINLGASLGKLGEFSQAKQTIEEGIQVAKENGLSKRLAEGYNQLYELYTDNNDYKTALMYFKKNMEITDSMSTADNNERIDDMVLKHKQEQQQRENEILRKEQQLQKARIENQNLLIFAIAACLVIAIVLAIVFFGFNRVRKRSNLQLHLLNNEISEQKEELAQQASNLQSANEEITAINENLEKLVEERTEEVRAKNAKLIEYSFINAHNLRGPLARILGLINILKKPDSGVELDDLVSKLERESQELDMVIASINKVLEDEGYLKSTEPMSK